MNNNVFQENHPPKEEYLVNRDNNISDNDSEDDENLMTKENDSESPIQTIIPRQNDEEISKNNEQNIYNYNRVNPKENSEIHRENLYSTMTNIVPRRSQGNLNQKQNGWSMLTYNVNKKRNFSSKKNITKNDNFDNFEKIDNSRLYSAPKLLNNFQSYNSLNNINRQTNYAPINLRDTPQDTSQNFNENYINQKYNFGGININTNNNINNGYKNYLNDDKNFYPNDQKQLKSNNIISVKKLNYDNTPQREINSNITPQSSGSISPMIPQPMINYQKYDNGNTNVFAANKLQNDIQKISIDSNNLNNTQKMSLENNQQQIYNTNNNTYSFYQKRNFNDENYVSRLTTIPKNNNIENYPLDMNINGNNLGYTIQERKTNIPVYQTNLMNYPQGQNIYTQQQINQNLQRANYLNKENDRSIIVKKLGPQNMMMENINNNQILNIPGQVINPIGIRGNINLNNGQINQINQINPNMNGNNINNINVIKNVNLPIINKLENQTYNNIQTIQNVNNIQNPTNINPYNQQNIINNNLINPIPQNVINNQNIQPLTQNTYQNSYTPSAYPTPENPLNNKKNVDITFSKFDDTGLLKNYGGVSRPGSDETGQQKIDQDCFVALTNINGIKDFNIFGVLDGHGSQGHLVSQLISELLPSKISNDPQIRNLNNTEHIYQTLKNNNFQIIKNAYQFADTTLATSTEIDASLSGTTCVLIFQIGAHIICSNTGDSRALLVYDQNSDPNLNFLIAAPLSMDYKPNLPEEMQRIISNGGIVEQFKGVDGQGVGPYRVFEADSEYPGLAMSRSIGDLRGKRVGVICLPGITECTISKQIKYIIICSDGVWEFLSNEVVAGIGKSFYLRNDPSGLCHELIKMSLQQWKEQDVVVDDITAVVCFF